MPNYKLSATLKQSMRRQAFTLLARRTAVEAADFPLTIEEVQDMFLDAKTVETCRDLHAGGISMSNRTAKPHIIVLAGDVVTHRCLVQLTAKQPIYFRDSATHYWTDYSQTRLGSERNIRVFDPATLPADRAELFHVWAARTLRAKRIEEMGRWVVRELLARHIKDTGNLLTTVPWLRLLVEDAMWKQRLNEPPARMKHLYVTLPADTARIANAIGPLLTGATMLPEELPKQDITGAVLAWERTKQDRLFPDAWNND